MNTRPNILLIMSDEHDPGVTGCYGNPIVDTPECDRLAEDGVLFENAYTNDPVCVPGLTDRWEEQGLWEAVSSEIYLHEMANF